jgi:hypothetical protein
MDQSAERRLRRDVNVLKVYALVTSTILVVLSLSAFQQSKGKQHFGEIDVERMNIVEQDGTPRLIFSNRARFPGLILHGKEYPHPRNTAGMLWFNEEGTENGGMTTGGRRGPNGFEADAGLTFDQYDQDQTVGLMYTDDNGRRSAGLHVWDRPETPILGLVERITAIRKMPEGAEKTRAMEELRKTGNGATRLFVGKTPDHAATISLADPQGRPRLKLSVDSTGAARVDFLDESGKVTSSLPSRP